jgi:hypothetical protein
MSKKIKWPKLKARGLRGRAGGEHYMDDATACDYIRNAWRGVQRAAQLA